MNVFVTSGYSADVVEPFLEDYLSSLTFDDTISTTNRNEDSIFINYALLNGINLKVYYVNEFITENAIEPISRTIDELLMFVSDIKGYFSWLYEQCSNQVILEGNTRMKFSDYQSLTEKMFKDKCEKLRSRGKIFNYHDHFVADVLEVISTVKRVKITIKEMRWHNV